MCSRLCVLAAGMAAMIRIDALWLATSPVDMRAGAEGLLARVVQVFGAAQAHHGYLFANARAIMATCFPTPGLTGSSFWCMTVSAFGVLHGV
jgi:hypothetical protein